jgi:hypothetical protein
MCLELEYVKCTQQETEELQTPSAATVSSAFKSRQIYTIYVSLLYSICMMENMLSYSQHNVSLAVSCLLRLLVK